MLKSLKIENFKRFRELDFPQLKRVNLIAGKNNTGKTGVLEALLLLLEQANALSALPSAFRNCANIGDATENFYKWLFRDRETSRPIVISTSTPELAAYAVVLEMPNAGQTHAGYKLVDSISLRVRPELLKTSLRLGAVPLSVRPSDPQQDAADYDRVVLKAGGEERLESLLRKLEPRLKSIRSIRPHGASLIYFDLGLKEKIPAVHLGQGFIRLLSIYSELIASDKRVLLIDEVENGLHHSVLTEIWRGLLHAAEQENVQIFATTHSYECIRAAHEAFSETLDYDFALHRLEEVKGDILVTTYDKETLETSLASNFEIR
jgi:hypothetical protein